MNRYPFWKYAIIVIALLVGAVYTLPNFFGEAPAVQISAGKSSVKVDAAVQARVEQVLQAANLVPDVVSLENGSLKVRFEDTDTQIHPRSRFGSRDLNGGRFTKEIRQGVERAHQQSDPEDNVFPNSVTVHSEFA